MEKQDKTKNCSLDDKIKFELSLYGNSEPSIDKIYEKIYLGNYAAALDKDILTQKKIQFILIASNNMEPYYKEELKIEYLKIPINDSKKTDITKYFTISNNFIDKAVNSKEGNILIHCGAGASRSVSILIAYMIYKFSIDYEESINFIKKIRDVANPNEGFVRQLKDYHYCLTNPL